MVNIELLKKAKKEKKMTFEQLSEESGVPLSTLYDLFRGVTTAPRVDTMEAIEKALGVGGQTLEWTEEDKALGVGSHPTVLSERERKWMELGSEVLRLKGEAYYEMLEKMIEAVIQVK